MKYFISLILVLVFSYSYGQKNKKIPQDSVIRRWQKSVFNIESSHEKYTLLELDQLYEKFIKANPNYSFPDSIRFMQSLRDQFVKVSGAATYIADGDKRYLITAKHVVYDRNWSTRHKLSTRDKSFHTSGYFEKLNSTITIKTPFDFYLKGKFNNFLLPEVKQDSANRPFTFSSDDIDLAIISLQEENTIIIRKALDEDGYTPIQIEDIDTLNNQIVGEDIFAIGFPNYSILGQINKNINIYQSKDVVLPLVTIGKIAMFHNQLQYFIGDITVYPGNSGGPVISNNKMIGLVSEQLYIPLDVEPKNYFDEGVKLLTRGTLTKLIRSKNILPLLRELQERERSFKK